MILPNNQPIRSFIADDDTIEYFIAGGLFQTKVKRREPGSKVTKWVATFCDVQTAQVYLLLMCEKMNGHHLVPFD